MNIKHKKDLCIEYGQILVGNFILALGVAWFILPNNVLTGGVAGIAVALYPVFYIEPKLLINVLTIVLFLIGSIVLGKKFAIKTILSSVCYPLFLTLLSNVSAEYFHTDIYLATIYGGALMGIGVGLVFRTGASTGGTDIPPLIINKYTHFPLPMLVLLTDALTVMLGAAFYGYQAALTGIISVWVSSYMIDKTMLFGAKKTKNVVIISQKYKEIASIIHQQLERGTSIINACGGYSNKSRPMIMSVVSYKQFPQLQQIVAQVDPEAFVIVMEANEVQGLGFSYDEVL